MKNSTIKMILLVLSSLLFYDLAPAQQKAKEDESFVQRKEYSISADTNNFIRIRFFSPTEQGGPFYVKAAITNMYGDTVATYGFYEKDKLTEDHLLVFDGNNVATFTKEYFIAITINDKTYNEEIEFPY